MEAEVKTTLVATITLKLTENEAYALNKMTGYNAGDFLAHIAKFCHGFDVNSAEAKGLISLMESAKKLYPALETIENIRKDAKEIKIV